MNTQEVRLNVRQLLAVVYLLVNVGVKGKSVRELVDAYCDVNDAVRDALKARTDDERAWKRELRAQAEGRRF